MSPHGKGVVLQLAAEFLEQLSEHMGAAGCNDYRWPDWVLKAVRRDIMRAHPDTAEDPEIEAVYTKAQHGADFMVVDALAALLRVMAAEASK